MKKETKALLTWIENSLNTYVSKFSSSTVFPMARKNCDNALAFLNSLPEIESHLRRGGYIQDSEGVPCCDGDLIVNESILDGKEEKGVLYWSKNDFRFYFKKADGVLNHLSINFRKVEK